MEYNKIKGKEKPKCRIEYRRFGTKIKKTKFDDHLMGSSVSLFNGTSIAIVYLIPKISLENSDTISTVDIIVWLGFDLTRPFSLLILMQLNWYPRLF